MDKNDYVEQESTETPEELLEETPEVEETPEEETNEQEDLQARLGRLQRENTKLKKVLETPKETLTKQPKTSVEDTEDIRETVKTLAVSEKKRQFGYKHGLSPEEVDAVFRIDPNPTKETLEDPFVKGGLGNVKRMKRISDNSPSPTSKSSSIGTMDFNKLDEHQKQAKFEEYMKSKKK